MILFIDTRMNIKHFWVINQSKGQYMKKWIEIISAVLGIVAALATILSSVYAFKSSGADVEKLPSLVRKAYEYGTFINDTVGLTPKAKEAQAPAAPPAPVPTIPVVVPHDNATIQVKDQSFVQQQEADAYKSEHFIVYAYHLTKTKQHVRFSFVIKNTTNVNIFVAYDGSARIAAIADSGSAFNDDIYGLQRAFGGDTGERAYTQISPLSENAVSVNFPVEQLTEKKIRINLNLLELDGKTVKRHTFSCARILDAP
ncbi:hypothetical protein [Humidesulfovibrio idahonensis]